MTRSIAAETVNVTDARARWRDLLNRVFRREARVIIERNGIPVAALVSAEDLRRLEQLDARRRADEELLARMSAAFSDLSEAEIEEGVAAAVAEARAELRHERELQRQHEQALARPR